jgi:hypothetical protein
MSTRSSKRKPEEAAGEITVLQTKGKTAAPKTRERVAITAPNFRTVPLPIVGSTPLVMRRFSQKAVDDIKHQHELGSAGRSRKPRLARDFTKECEDALYVSQDGWVGFPCSAFRAAFVSACRLVDATMQLAKLTIFVEADGLDRLDGTPLVRIVGDWQPDIRNARISFKSTTVVARPLFPQWEALLRVQWDTDRFTLQDIVHLAMRAGLQVGIGEGRPDSRSSVGLNWGRFEVVTGSKS